MPRVRPIRPAWQRWKRLKNKTSPLGETESPAIWRGFLFLAQELDIYSQKKQSGCMIGGGCAYLEA